MAMSELLNIEHLSVSFAAEEGKMEAVRDVSFSLKSGEVLAIVGESGCGKSVLCKSIMKLLPKNGWIEKGSIAVNGEDIAAYPEKKMQKLRGSMFSMVFQDPMSALDPTVRIGRQIAEAIRMHNRTLSREEIGHRVTELMELVGIDHVQERCEWFPHQFTEGYQAFAIKKIAGVPSILWILVLAFILAVLFLGYTSRGRRIYAIGTNRESAQIAGIKEQRVIFLAMTICGMFAGLSGMLYTANYATCSYMIGDSYEMTAIAICILGGVSITGGKGKVDGVIIGFLMMSVITYFISLLPGLSVWSDAIQGAIIIAAVALNIFTEHSAKKRALKERGALI